VFPLHSFRQILRIPNFQQIIPQGVSMRIPNKYYITNDNRPFPVFTRRFGRTKFKKCRTSNDDYGDFPRNGTDELSLGKARGLAASEAILGVIAVKRAS